MADALGFCAATKIVSSAVGLLCNKVYDSITDQFKDGDVAKESVHEIISRDLNDIKSKLECLSRKDLDASYSFLKEGVQLLNLAIDTPTKESRRFSKESASDILKEASSLRKAIQGLNISSATRFLSAEVRFRASRERATDAFNNKSLSTENRIMACKLRVASTILESGLEDPELAVAACLVSLKELHGLPGVQDMLSVFLKGGLKSKLKTGKRLGNIMSVLSINHALFDFASKHSSEYPNVFTWPAIKLKDRNVNPILHAREILEKTPSSEEFSRPLSRICIDRRMQGSCFAVNSRSEAVLLCDDRIKVIKSTGEWKDVMVSETAKIIAVDSNDNVYVVRFVRAYDGNERIVVLNVFDENYSLRHETILPFLDADITKFAKIAVDKNGNIIAIQGGDNHVYICDSKGKLKFQFERDSSQAYSLSITDNDEVIIPSDDRRSVHVYTSEGIVKFTIKIPEGHKIWKVAFHHGISKMIVLTYVKERRHISLLCYSERGELENSEFLCDERIPQCDVKGHSSGPFAALSIEEQCLVYLRL